MMTEITRTIWHGFEAVTLESGEMRVVILPQLGGKIVSMYDKTHQHEWLVPPMRPLKQTSYGDDFVSQDMSGWDEMMPTINRCRWMDAELPDHGEVWSIPWDVETAVDGLVLSVQGRALPYRFTRSAALTAANCLELRYTLLNSGQTALAYLWAAHPQFAADECTRILLPPEVRSVVNVVDNDPLWGAAGQVVAWPQASTPDGQVGNLDRVGRVEQHTCRKVYLRPDQPAAWAALVQEDRHCELRMEWDPAEVPYLGIWVDEGMYNARAAAALEPCSGYYDSLESAAANQRVTVLPPGGQCTWTLRIHFLSR